MAVIEDKIWHGEPIKAVIKFDDKTEYTVYTDFEHSTSENFIKEIKFSLSEGNSSVNPLGIAVSNSINMQIFDKDDNLSPVNKNSIYYGKVVNGVEIDLFISYDGSSFEPYGIYFATSWDGQFSEGYHGLVNVSADDRLNTLGNYDMPELPAYSNVEAGDLIANVMSGLGLGTDEYTIDPSINQSLMYGIAQGGKVREFLNNICQLLFARVVIDRAGVVRFVPALSIYNNANEMEIGSDYTGTFQNKNNSNINYNKISVKYLEAGETSRETLFTDNSHVLNDGENVITDINFKFRALSVESVSVLFNGASTEDGPVIDSLTYRGYQNGIQLNIDVSNGPINECRLTGTGVAVSTTDRKVTVDVDNATVIGGSTFEFDTKQMMSKSKAQEIANNLKNYLSIINRNVIMSGTAITPRLNIGDKLTLSNTGTMYDGQYKVTGMNISIGEDYTLDATLIRIA